MISLPLLYTIVFKSQKDFQKLLFCNSWKSNNYKKSKRAKKQRSYESMYKTEAKRLRETTFAITELEKYVTFESSVLAEYTTAEHPLAIACPNSKSARLQFRASTF